MSAIDDVARMLTLVPWLIERPGASLTEIAEAFGVSTERIRRDLFHLDFCGSPGLGGGALFDVSVSGDRVLVQMADELREPLRLTPREGLSLILAGEAAAAALGEELPALRSALDVLRDAAGVPADVSVVLADGAARWLPDLRVAVQTGRQIQMSYQGRGDDRPQPRRVDPWGLRVERGEWYLQARDHAADDLRSFRVDRIVELEVTDEPAEVAAPAEELPRPRYVPHAGDTRYVLEVDARARWLRDAVDVDELSEQEDGTQRLVFHSDAPAWITSLLLVAGPGARVLEPADAAEARRAAAVDALARYRT